MISKWDELKIEDKVIDILFNAKRYPEGHHFGLPFFTAYQLAIAFAQAYPNDAESLGYLHVGGKGIGERSSLAQYLARELSGRIHNGSIQNVEGRFLSNQFLDQISFNSGGEVIVSSLTDGQNQLSMFRYLEEKEHK